jgi:hypothetical protein
MKLTPKQLKDLETILYFIPAEMKDIRITESDIKKFFDFSDKGIKVEKRDYTKFAGLGGADGLDTLIQGKVRRGLHMGMWEEGGLEGTVPYRTLLSHKIIKRKWWKVWEPLYSVETPPRSLVDFMKKEMFKGIDADIIEEVYQENLDEAYRIYKKLST